MKRKKKLSREDLLMDSIIILILTIFSIICLYPMWYVVVASFTNATELSRNPGLLLWPEKFVTEAYRMVFSNRLLKTGLLNSVKILVIALPINIVMTMLCGYFLACKGMMFKKPLALMIMFTMYFGGGLIPEYLNIRSLGLLNTIWALVLPGALNIYRTMICKSAIQAIPDSLTESAYIDGANDFKVLFRIIMPLIRPTLAVLLLYYGVTHWNSWFTASIYMKEDAKLPVQNILRSILLANSELSGTGASGDTYNAYAETIKYAAIVVTTVPVLCIYPFLQKYFTKGALVGAVKG